jgi:hypothetical protein
MATAKASFALASLGATTTSKKVTREQSRGGRGWRREMRAVDSSSNSRTVTPLGRLDSQQSVS